MNPLIYLVPLLVLAVIYLLWPVFAFESEASKYKRIQKAERKRIQKYWKERGKVIHPRYCTALDEREDLS